MAASSERNSEVSTLQAQGVIDARANASATLSSSTLRNPAKSALADGAVVSCMAVKLLRTPDVARLAHGAGFGAIYIDMEHGIFDLSVVSQICLTAYDLGLSALVRCGREHIAQVLDAGAMGVIVPHVSSAQAAREIVAQARFPPLGERGSVNRLPQLNYRMFPAKQLHAASNQAILVIVMIESKEALENIDEIAAVAGVDILFIGANDLSADLGIAGDYDNLLMQAAFKVVLAAAKTHHKYVALGGLGTRPDLLRRYVSQGARVVSIGADLTLFCDAAQKCVEDCSLNLADLP